MAGKLFQEYIVDAWAPCEQACLLYIQTHQKELQAETYQGVVDALGGLYLPWVIPYGIHGMNVG